AVTYVIQRGESMMGLFYLLTLYCAIRALDSPGRAAAWSAAAVGACLLGVGSKEVIVAAPLVVMLYDYTFLDLPWRQRLRKRAWLYAGLIASWLPLVWLIRHAVFQEDSSAGFG